MAYIWQDKNWPEFKYDASSIESDVIAFSMGLGQSKSIIELIDPATSEEIISEILADEAMKTSEIEGEMLARSDVVSSIRKNLGIHSKQASAVRDPRAKGVAKMIVDLRKTALEPLSESMLFRWHKYLFEGNNRLNVGTWRSHSEPMQVVSGAIGREIVHYQAPPSKNVPKEMNRFIQWFNAQAKASSKTSPLIFAAIAHLYFETIHPFEDGNGRIGRSIAEKALSMAVGHPVLLSLSHAIEFKKKDYYNALKQAQSNLEITPWIQYFVGIIDEAQKRSLAIVNHTIRKIRLLSEYADVLNERQVKVIQRMTRNYPEPFDGGMTAKKYMAITKSSKATATRDLQGLVDSKIFVPQGAGRNVSYRLVI